MTPLNLQPREGPDRGTGETLDAVRVWKTIQGEGPFSGRPAVFVRLAGCNLDCPGCDTDYTRDRQEVGIHSLLETVEAVNSATLGAAVRLVVLTGGEPFRQPVGPFARLLLYSGYQVQVETNGTRFPEDFPWAGDVVVVCSPKSGVSNSLKPYVHSLKYVVRHDQLNPTDGLPVSVLGNAFAPERPWPGFRGEVYVSPEDSGDDEVNALNRQAAVRSCFKNGYRLSLQTHKLIGVD